jgi:hypothetical protein
MKLFFSMVMVYLLGSFGASFAKEVPPTRGGNQSPLLSCETEADKKVSVSRDQVTDTFTILYGKDLSTPERVVIRQGNDMGTSYHYHQGEATEIREIYATDKKEFVTVGVVDKGGNVSAYFEVQQNVVKSVSDKCKPDTIKNNFSLSENFKSLTEVD